MMEIDTADIQSALSSFVEERNRKLLDYLKQYVKAFRVPGRPNPIVVCTLCPQGKGEFKQFKTESGMLTHYWRKHMEQEL